MEEKNFTLISSTFDKIKTTNSLNKNFLAKTVFDGNVEDLCPEIFGNCISLESVSLPETLSYIEHYFFKNFL